MFKKSSDVFQEQVKDIFSIKDDTETEVILKVVELVLHHGVFNDDLLNLYRRTGMDNFVSVIDIFGGRTIKLPRVSEIKEAITLALCFYYKELKRKNWKEIKALLPFEISSISYGTRIKGLNSFVQEKIKELLEGKGLNEKDCD